MNLRLTILGCGSSGGVPRVSQGWGACDPNEPRNRRLRCSLLVERISENGTTTVLVDTSPDLREQLLTHGVERLDAILLTHAHADHLHGIDDVRPLVIQMRRRIPIYMDTPTRKEVWAKFGYVLETPPGSSYPPLLLERPLHAGQPVRVDGPGGPVEATPIRFRHGDIDALGFRFGNILYSPDISGVPPESFDHLANLDAWIIDALRYTPHPSHITVAQALDLIAKVEPKAAVLTNLHTDLDYRRLGETLPSHVRVAFDGLCIEALDE